jgi:hypothetical protein
MTWSSSSGSTRASTRRTVAPPGWPPDPAERVAAHPERGRHRPGRVGGPLADPGQRPGAGHHRGDRHGQHRAERVPSATPVAWVGDLGEVVEQTTALVGRQRGGRGQPMDVLQTSSRMPWDPVGTERFVRSVPLNRIESQCAEPLLQGSSGAHPLSDRATPRGPPGSRVPRATPLRARHPQPGRPGTPTSTASTAGRPKLRPTLAMNSVSRSRCPEPNFMPAA